MSPRQTSFCLAAAKDFATCEVFLPEPVALNAPPVAFLLAHAGRSGVRRPAPARSGVAQSGSARAIALDQLAVPVASQRVARAGTLAVDIAAEQVEDRLPT